jgi:hypothetical protein
MQITDYLTSATPPFTHRILIQVVCDVLTWCMPTVKEQNSVRTFSVFRSNWALDWGKWSQSCYPECRCLLHSYRKGLHPLRKNSTHLNEKKSPSQDTGESPTVAWVRAQVRSCRIWWTKWHSGRFSPSTSVSTSNFHSTDCSTLIIYHPGLVQ